MPRRVVARLEGVHGGVGPRTCARRSDLGGVHVIHRIRVAWFPERCCLRRIVSNDLARADLDGRRKRLPCDDPEREGPVGGQVRRHELSVTLWPHGVITAGGAYVTRSGEIRMKFPWWRGVRGHLRITGHRIDASAPPLGTQVPHGYGSTGFQASGVTFPTEGCWFVTGSVGSTRLTFVTFVIRR